ncbi:hypothetical protein AVDCRST_MAG81-3412, partial [uncultured Synechococcales cyanobacterium]
CSPAKQIGKPGFANGSFLCGVMFLVRLRSSNPFLNVSTY